MASTTALFTGLSGLTANARSLDVIGNNIANSNTTAFKSNRLLFASQFSRNFSIGTVPSTNTGGTNPGQVGLGVTIAGTQRDFSGGALSATGDARDLAIEGDGFFIVNRGGTPYYTRAGAFRQNSTNDLVTISGERVRGYGVDANFNIVQGELVDLNIPVGTLTLAEATRSVRFAGNLNSSGDLPTQGSVHTLRALDLLTGPVGSDLLTLDSLLIDIQDPDNPGSPLFTDGQSFQVQDAQRGTKTIPAASLDITDTTTVQDFIEFLNASLGINTDVAQNPDGLTPGVSLEPSTGVLTIVGNTGEVNNLDFLTADLRILNPDGTTAATPFTPTRLATADGESVRNTFVVFDSLGTALNVDITMVLESRQGGSGTTWRYFADSADAAGLATALNTGTIDFDENGRLTGSTGFEILMDRTGSGAASPLNFSVDFASESDSVTALASQDSALAATFQDGAPLGTLSSYSVGTNGIITGAFTNGLTRTVGQVAIATFSNPEGLVDVGSNLFTPGPNSGTPVVGEPLALGAGRIVGGSLELSNVDLSQEFINLILASTGYSAASRVITTTDQLMQQLLVLGR
ncbi:MAG: flagellar hook-basal body complex protein [Phycisphaerales bacterium]|nr:flagellar hook-basal body complex protein [Phycisphaerales bacterium]